MERFGGYKGESGNRGNQAQQEAYLTNPPTDMMAHCAGEDPSCPQSHVPSWVTVPVNPILPQLLVPGLWKEVLKVRAAFEECLSSSNPHTEQMARRLYSAKGCVEYIYSADVRFIQMAAARPLLSQHPMVAKLDRASPPLYQIILGSQLG